MEQVATALKLHKVLVAGSSVGATYALALAAYLPDRVQATLLISPSGSTGAGLVQNSGFCLLKPWRRMTQTSAGLAQRIHRGSAQQMHRCSDLPDTRCCSCQSSAPISGLTIAAIAVGYMKLYLKFDTQRGVVLPRCSGSQCGGVCRAEGRRQVPWQPLPGQWPAAEGRAAPQGRRIPEGVRSGASDVALA